MTIVCLNTRGLEGSLSSKLPEPGDLEQIKNKVRCRDRPTVRSKGVGQGRRANSSHSIDGNKKRPRR